MIKSKLLNSPFEFLFNKNNVNSKRSQSAIEFMILMGFLLFSFTVFFLIIQGNMADKLKEREGLSVKSIAITVQDEINLASEASDGYRREFKIPNNINGREYEINATEGVVYIRTLDRKYAMAFPVQNITGEVKKGDNVIEKENGEVKLNV